MCTRCSDTTIFLLLLLIIIIFYNRVTNPITHDELMAQGNGIVWEKQQSILTNDHVRSRETRNHDSALPKSYVIMDIIYHIYSNYQTYISFSI